MSVSIDAPVVVKPDIASKYASMGRSSCALAREQVRQRSESRGDEPRHRDDEEPLAKADRGSASADPLEPEPDERHHPAGGKERPERLAVSDREGRREQHGDGQVLGERPDETERTAELDRHVRPVRSDASTPSRASQDALDVRDP